MNGKVFRRELGAVRKAGYASNVDGRVLGAAGVAAPIWGPGGVVVAAINISAPTSRFEAVQARLTESAVQGARQISKLLELSPMSSTFVANGTTKRSARVAARGNTP